MTDITATTTTDRIQVFPDGSLQIFKVVTYSDGRQAWDSPLYYPGDDTAAETDTQFAAIKTAVWTTAVVAAYKTAHSTATTTSTTTGATS